MCAGVHCRWAAAGALVLMGCMGCWSDPAQWAAAWAAEDLHHAPSSTNCVFPSPLN